MSTIKTIATVAVAAVATVFVARQVETFIQVRKVNKMISAMMDGMPEDQVIRSPHNARKAS